MNIQRPRDETTTADPERIKSHLLSLPIYSPRIRRRRRERPTYDYTFGYTDVNKFIKYINRGGREGGLERDLRNGVGGL